MTTEKFRRQLREESQQWRQEGLIDANLYDTLVERYRFNLLPDEPDNRFIGILLGLGGILLGLGAITFVAANWQAWSRVARTVLLLVLFLGVNGTGFYLWRDPSQRPRFHRLGHGLLLTGALVLGANLGLMSQMFHQSGPIYQLFMVWGLGVLAMAYGLRLMSLGILSWILIMLGYWSFTIEAPGGADEFTFFSQLMAYLPLLLSLLYLPLAHWLRSRWLFGLWGLGFAFLFGVSQARWVLGSYYASWAIAAAFVLPPALLWVYRANWRARHSAVRPDKDYFQPIGRSLAVWSISFSLYFFAFRFPWQYNPFNESISIQTGSILPPSLSLGVYFIAALYGWWRVLRTEKPLFRRRWLTSYVMAGILLMMYGLAIAYTSGTSLIAGPIVINVLLFSLSLFLIHDGLLLSVRRRFWGGMIILVMGLISRMFEYNTDLTLKAIVLSLCGLGIIAAGLWFEYRIKQPSHSTLPEGNS